ncbi:RNA polymerase, sigma-24 subunit, ECF subfamily [Desulfofarcimen acetoxidans DSM 771]|uniref:RNA polymerase, sigma-24 subunit, ECF subfamily n=1 Tax=Desulfofarcimen acetoxidans (strain ATCC 49208 / DSM 771 / KCTC 5769 / VKM B-1644 / 5575) TaxID=485916 RepID=C8VZR6_DESAS|nr:helix-turn-helix domain-containing protein [Desulfofarcimen acetoxidans]ACV63044.1 RNA polymerase, sigma-24 subunit, ECF subfamily [Desulfofarcimen acetoxidans DSM 771]
MTDEQRQKIKSLRYQGFGYKEIAKAIGLSRDTIRGYCKRNGLHGFATELVAGYKKIMKEEFLFTLCLNCGKKLEQNSLGRKRKYCSMNCKAEWEKTHRKSYTSYCEYCGNEFKTLGIKERKYCSHNCYTKDRFWREEDAAEVANKILEFKKVNHLPKWLKDLLLANNEA